MEIVAAGPWTAVDVIDEQPRFRLFSEHSGWTYDLAARATFNEVPVFAFRMSCRKKNDVRSVWSTSFRLRTCVVAELPSPVPSLCVSNRAIHDLEKTFFDGMRRVRGTPRPFRQVFSARTHNRDFAREVLNDACCSLLLAEPGFSCVECGYEHALFVFDGDADRDHAVAFALSFVDRLRAATADTGSVRVRVPGA